MKLISKTISLALAAALLPVVADAENVVIGGKTYQMDRLIERQIAPGTTYLRLRFPEIPLNVNLVMADMTNPYVRVENVAANESAKSTEKIASAASRLSTPGHKAVAGQNANFWAVTSQQPDGKLFSSQTRNASIRNGKMVTECNMSKEMAFGGPVTTTGILGISPEKDVYVDYCLPNFIMKVNDGFALYTIAQCNKGVHPDEIAMYNSFYGAERAFRPIAADLDGGYYKLDEPGDAIEVLLDLNEDSRWMGGEFIEFTVKEIRPDAGAGTLGNYDLALVGRGNGRTKLERVNVGDKVSIQYSFKFSPSETPVSPLVETAIGGNLLMMHNSQVLPQCTSSSYDNTTYARSLYGTSADHKTLYMMVIDKATDPVYGSSAGLNTAKAADIARHFGCTDMLQCDGGGSAQLYVTKEVVNKTTESTPRAVANCLMIFDDAPEKNVISDLAIDYPGKVIELPAGGTFSPVVLMYNEYGSYLGGVTSGFTVTCSEGLGSVDGTTFTASATPVYGEITVTYSGKSVTKEVSVGGAQSGIESIVATTTGKMQLNPSSATAGTEVAVIGDDISRLEIYNTEGQLIDTVKPMGGDITIKAPMVSGLYLVSALTSTGRQTARLLVL
ncbi:MAG: phosphodiester glycosidase family protein [Lachnoclostridium sp.]|nr:phosphodiester glycosidase family protein [Lachnoclostridium sp.]